MMNSNDIISQLSPDVALAEALAMYPALETRTIKASQLWIDGRVELVGENAFVVHSESRNDYNVWFNRGIDDGAPGWHCSCPDYEHNAPAVDFYGSVGRPICKHIIAVFFVEVYGGPTFASDDDNVGQAEQIRKLEHVTERHARRPQTVGEQKRAAMASLNLPKENRNGSLKLNNRGSRYAF